MKKHQVFQTFDEKARGLNTVEIQSAGWVNWIPSVILLKQLS